MPALGRAWGYRPLRSVACTRACVLRNVHTVNEQKLATLEEIAAERRANRRFLPDPIPDGLLKRLLKVAQRAPSGYNLQPWVAVVVSAAEQRAELLPAALGQKQVEEAPAVVVFAGNTRPTENIHKAWLLGLHAGCYPRSYEPIYYRNIRFMLETGSCGALQVFKYGLTQGIGSMKPAPSVPLSMQGYAWKQTMPAVMNFMNAATAAGLATSPMEGIDENAVKKVVGLPDHYTVPCIVAVGYPQPSQRETPAMPRFPTEDVIFDGKFGDPLQ